MDLGVQAGGALTSAGGGAYVERWDDASFDGILRTRRDGPRTSRLRTETCGMGKWPNLASYSRTFCGTYGASLPKWGPHMALCLVDQSAF